MGNKWAHALHSAAKLYEFISHLNLALWALLLTIMVDTMLMWSKWGQSTFNSLYSGGIIYCMLGAAVDTEPDLQAISETEILG